MDSRQKRLSSWQQQETPVIETPEPPKEVINIITPTKPVQTSVVEQPEPVEIVADVLADEQPKVSNLKKLKKQD